MSLIKILGEPKGCLGFSHNILQKKSEQIFWSTQYCNSFWFFICRNIFWSTDIILLASLLTWMASSLSKNHLFKVTMQWWKAAICSTTLKSSFSPSYGQYCPRCQAGNLRAPTEAAGSLAASLSGHPGPLNMVCRSHMSLCFWKRPWPSVCFGLTCHLDWYVSTDFFNFTNLLIR